MVECYGTFKGGWFHFVVAFSEHVDNESDQQQYYRQYHIIDPPHFPSPQLCGVDKNRSDFSDVGVCKSRLGKGGNVFISQLCTEEYQCMIV